MKATNTYKKLRKLNALNEDRRHANEYKRRQENILQISKAENVQYKINNWLSGHVALKTRRGFAADWAEFGVVFHPFKW